MLISSTDGARPRRSVRTGGLIAAVALAAGVLPAVVGAVPAEAAPPCSTTSLVRAFAAHSGGGTIVLPPWCGYTLHAPDNAVDGGTALPVITGDVTVIGNGATIARAAGSGTPAFRLLDVAAGGALKISDVALNNGLAPIATPPASGWGGGAISNHGSLVVSHVSFDHNVSPSHSGTSGGAIDSAGPLQVADSTFTNNVAQEGGAIFAQDTTTISDTTFDGNTATDYGGGAVVNGSGTTTVSGSTFANNVAVDTTGYTLGGGAIDNDAGLSVTDSTFFNNQGGSNGGGAIQNFGTASVTSSTMAGNTSQVSGSDIHAYAGTPGTVVTTVASSILASGPESCGGNAPITDGGYNIDVGTSCGFTTANHSQSGTDPQLTPPAANGGPTETMKPNPGSPAIDAVPASVSSCSGTDQRGVARPQGAGCDIGSVEVVNRGGTTGACAPPFTHLPADSKLCRLLTWWMNHHPRGSFRGHESARGAMTAFLHRRSHRG